MVENDHLVQILTPLISSRKGPVCADQTEKNIAVAAGATQQYLTAEPHAGNARVTPLVADTVQFPRIKSSKDLSSTE